MSSTEAKIRALLFSPSKENQNLGWLLDKVQNGGKIKRTLEAEQATLLRQLAGWTIERLLLAERIVCNDKNASNIHIKNLPKLISLSCKKHHQLLTFQTSNCPNLEQIYCSNNNALESLRMENCPQLTYISCFDNQLSDLKIEAPKLMHIYAASNQLEHFDITPFPDLVSLKISQNPMKTLKVSALQKENFPVNLATFTKVIT